jgi:hypothetical protein
MVICHAKHTLRLLNVMTGKEITPQSAECDYFSTPAAFSSDEKSLVCIDGEMLRFWDLTTTPASLAQSVALTNLEWTGIFWNLPDTVVVSSRSTLTSDRPTYQLVRKDKSNVFTLVGPPKLSTVLKQEKEHSVFRLREDNVSLTGGFL